MYQHSHYCPVRKRPVPTHIAAAEKAFGHFMPPGAVVHHLNGDPLDNRNENLVICPDEAYHNLLHIRLEAYQACGDANKRRCYVCKDYDSLSVLLEVRKAGRAVTTFYHSECRKAYRAQYKQRTGRTV